VLHCLSSRVDLAFVIEFLMSLNIQFPFVRLQEEGPPPFVLCCLSATLKAKSLDYTTRVPAWACWIGSGRTISSIKRVVAVVMVEMGNSDDDCDFCSSQQPIVSNAGKSTYDGHWTFVSGDVSAIPPVLVGAVCLLLDTF
jgi:hypothetical protein